MRALTLLLVLGLAALAPAAAAPAAAAASSAAAAASPAALLGRWEGSSLCTDIPGNGFCHDEHVLYEFTALRGGRAHLAASKLVAGKFAPMGEMDFAYEPARKRWSAEFRGPRAHGLWLFEVRGDTLVGTCELLPSHAVARHARAERRNE